MLMSLNCVKCKQRIMPDQEEVFLSSEISQPIACHMECLTPDTSMPTEVRARFNSNEIQKLREQNKDLANQIHNLFGWVSTILQSQGVDSATIGQIQKGQFPPLQKSQT